MVSYAYWGDFRRIANAGSGLASYGFPIQTANVNRYNMPNTAPFVDATEMAEFISANVTPQWTPDNTDYPSSHPVQGYTLEQTPGSAAMVITAGGISAYQSAYGVAMANTEVVTDPDTQLTRRWIIIPNTHATVDGTAPSDPLAVTPNIFYALPMIPVSPQTTATDVMGTPIVNPDQFGDDITNDYIMPNLGSGESGWLYFFILPNAWKFGSGDWYVDVTVPPLWSEIPPGIISHDGRTHAAWQDILSAPPQVANSNLLSVANIEARSTGYEDMVATEAVTEPPFITIDYNDLVVVFASGALTP